MAPSGVPVLECSRSGLEQTIVHPARGLHTNEWIAAPWAIMLSPSPRRAAAPAKYPHQFSLVLARRAGPLPPTVGVRHKLHLDATIVGGAKACGENRISILRETRNLRLTKAILLMCVILASYAAAAES